jgi:hypothetical protein
MDEVDVFRTRNWRNVVPDRTFYITILKIGGVVIVVVGSAWNSTDWRQILRRLWALKLVI